jgi:hypothetical protein
MAKGYLPLPDGSYVTVRDDETPEQAFARARKEYPEAFEVKRVPAEPEEGVIAAGIGSTKRAISTARTGLESLFSPEEAARKGVERAEELGQQYAPGTSLEAVKQAYADRGLMGGAGEVISQIPTALVEQFPQIAATLGGARAGAAAGARFGPKGALIGGIGGAVVPSALQLFGANIERQAAEQMEEGKPLDISRTRAAPAAVLGSALEVAATFIPLGRTLIGKVLGPEATKAMTRVTAEGRENLAKEGLAKVLAKGTATGALLEIPTEVIQQMLERAQAGLPLTSEDAYAEYGEAAYGAGLVGGPFGAVGRVGQRSVARGEIAEKEAAATAEEQRKAAEAARLEQEQAEAEEKTRLVSPEYRLELNNTIVNSKDRLADVEALLKSKIQDPDVKKEAIEEAKTLRKTIKESEAKMRQSMIAAGLKPDISKLEEALGKQAPTDIEERTVVDEFGNVVTPKTQPVTEEEEAAGYERMVELQKQKDTERQESLDRINREDLARQIVEDEIQQNAPLVRTMPEGDQPAQSFVPFTSLTDATQIPKPKSMRDDVWAAMSSKDKLDMARRDRIAAYTEVLADPATAQAIEARRTDTERQKLNNFLEDEASKDQTAVEIQKRQATDQALDDIAETQIKRATDQLGLGVLFLGPVRQRRVEQGVNEGKVNRYVASALEIKDIGGRTVSVDDARKNIQEAIGNLKSERQDLVGKETQILEPEGGLTPDGIRIAQIDVKLSELDRLLLAGETKDPTATESAIAGRLAGELEGQGDVFAPDLLKAPTSTLKGKLDTARKQSTGAFTDLVSYLDDYRAGRFFGPKGAKRDIKFASSTREGLLRESEEARKQLVTNIVEEVAIKRAQQKLRPLTNAEADTLRAAINQKVDELIDRSQALPSGYFLKDIVIQPVQMRGTEIVRGAEIKRIDTRDLSQRQFAAPQEAVKVIAEELALLRDSQQVFEYDPKTKRGSLKQVIPTGERQTRAAYTPTFDLAGEVPRTKTRVSQEDRLLEEIKRVLATPNLDPTVAKTLDEAADMIANEDVSADFVELVDEQVGRILTGVDRPFAERDPTQRTKRPLEAPLIKEIRADLDEMRRGREFAEADDTMMVTAGKKFKEVETQPDLFPETKATTRATPAMFRRFLKSGKITDFNKALQEERDALEKAEKTAKIQDDIRRRKPTNNLVQLAENIEEQLKVIKDVLLGTKTTPGVLEEKRAELQEAQKLVQAEIERLAASIQADKKKIESDKIKLATAKRGTSLSRNLARERKPLIKELEANIKALTAGIPTQEARIEDLAGIIDNVSETYAQQLAFFDKRVASEVEFYKKLLKKAQELGGVRLKQGVESAYSVKSLPFVATTTVPRKARLPIKRQLSSQQLQKVKELLFNEQRILEAIRKESSQGLAVGKLQEDLQQTRDALRGIVDVDNVRNKIDLDTGTYIYGYSYEQLNTAATKIQKAAAKARGMLLKAGDVAKAEAEKQNKANEAFQMRLVNKLGLPGTTAKAIFTEVKKGKGKKATTDVVRRVKATRDETQTPEQIIEDLGKLEAAVKAGTVGKETAKAISKGKGASLVRAVTLQVAQEIDAQKRQTDLFEELKSRAKLKQDPIEKLLEIVTSVTPQQRKGYFETYTTLANDAQATQQKVDNYIKKNKNAENDAKLGELRADAIEAADDLRAFERNVRFNLTLPDILEDEAATPRQKRPKAKTKAGPVMGFDKKFTPDQMRDQIGMPSKQGIKIKTNNPPEFSIGDSDPTGEIDVAEAKKFLADVKAKAAKQGIKVKIYPLAEVLSPELYGDALASLGLKNAMRIKGGVDPDGTVFFVIGSHNNLQDLKETVAHELIGHYTFEGMLGEKGLKRLLNRLEKTYGNISKLAEKIGGQALLKKVHQAEVMMKKLGKSDDEVRMRGLNELVAYTMEKRVDQDFLTRAKQWLQELVGALRLGLRELGIDMGGMSTSELFYLMRQADRNFKAGKPVARIESDGTVKYSVADSAVDNTGINKMIAQRGEYFDDAKSFATGMFGLAGRVKFLDRFAALEAVMKKSVSAGVIDSLKAFDAMYFSRMADQLNNFVAQFATGGVGKIVTKNGERMYEGGDGPSLKDVSEALVDSGVPANRVELEFTGYIAALRAKQIPGGIKKLSTEGGVTEAEINQKIAQYANNAAFQKARKLYQEYNNNLIDFVESSGAITKELATKLKGVDYIPFYRAKGNDVFLDVMGEQPIRIGDLKNQPYLEKLLGGKKQILPIFTSALTNTSVLTNMALKNMATANTADALRMIGVAKVNKGQGPANPDVIRFKVNGQDFHAVVDTQAKSDLFGDIPTELVVQGMEGIKATLPVGVRLLGAPANLLRKFVTRDPRYAFRQIFRDSMAAAMTTGADFVPVVQTFKDMATMKKTGALQTLQKRFIVGGQVISGSTDDMGKILLQIGSGKPGWESAMAKLDELAMMGDAATRVSMYNSFLKQGLSEREATFATLEAMNFSRRGTSPTMLYANTLIPFFNAAVQGLDVMYRALRSGNKKYAHAMPASERLRVKQKLVARMGIMAGITLMYAIMMQDDETYENANADERYGNWFVPTPFGTMRIPIPFELGLVAKAAPEGLYRLAFSDDSMSEVTDALRTMALRSIPIDIPTAIKPAIEWNMNRSFFTGRDLVTASMPEDPKFQYNLNTSEIIKLFGNLGVSPVKLENFIKGYTGSLGVSALRLLDPVFGGEIVKPGQGLANVPIVGGLFQPEDASGIINAAYNTANNIEGINRTYKRLEVEDPDEADKYYDEKLDELSMASDAGRFKQYMGALTKEEREIRADKTLDPKKKDEYLKEIRQEKIEASKEFRQLAAQM